MFAQCPIRQRSNPALFWMVLGTIALAMPLWQWWPLALWVGASVLTAGLLTPPWDRRLIQWIEAAAPVKRQWLTYLLIALLWMVVLALFFVAAGTGN